MNPMTKAYGPGAIGALLGEYQRAIIDLQQTIADFSNAELVATADDTTTDIRCRSVKAVLSHVVSAGRAYAIYIRRLKDLDAQFAGDVFRLTISDFRKDLDELFRFTLDTFSNIRESELEELNSERKITTKWGQVYDIEQMMEHAIVHVLRHRRQIEQFKQVLRERE